MPTSGVQLAAVPPLHAPLTQRTHCVPVHEIKPLQEPNSSQSTSQSATPRQLTASQASRPQSMVHCAPAHETSPQLN